MSAEKKSILMNLEGAPAPYPVLLRSHRPYLTLPPVIAINQDGSNTAGDRIANGTNGEQTWSRPLLNGDKAVILYNSGQSKKPQVVGVTWAEVGWPESASVTVRDLWAAEDLGTFRGGYNATVGPREVAMLRLQLRRLPC